MTNKIYTHVWRIDNIYETEGKSASTVEEALGYLQDYSYAWEAKGYQYCWTYVDNLTEFTVEKVYLQLEDECK